MHKLLPHSRRAAEEADEEVEERRTDALLYLARAFFLWGQLDEAVKALDEAVKRRHLSGLVWYNRGLAQEEFAIAVLRKRVEERTLEEVTRAVSRLEEAERTFTALEAGAKAQQKEGRRTERKREEKDKGDEPREEEKKAADEPTSPATSTAADLNRAPLQVSESGQLLPPPAALLDCSGCLFPLQEKALAHALFCRDTLTKAAVHLKAAEAREGELAAIAERAQKAKEEAAERLRVEREEREAKEREDIARAEEVARLNKEKLASLQENWVTTRRAEEKEEDADAADEADEGGDRRKRKGRKKKGRRGSASDDDAGDEEGTARKKRSKRRKTEAQRTQDDDHDLPGDEGAAEGEERPEAREDEEAPAESSMEAEEGGDNEEVPEWKRLQAERNEARRRNAQGGAASMAAPPAAEEVDGRDARRQRRLRRGGEAAEAEVEGAQEGEERVRGLDEDDEAEVRAEEGREAETEAVVAEVADLRRPARRKAIVEDDEDEGEGEAAEVEAAAEAAVAGVTDLPAELNVSHAAENEAPIHREGTDTATAGDADESAETERRSTQAVSAEAMDTD